MILILVLNMLSGSLGFNEIQSDASTAFKTATNNINTQTRLDTLDIKALVIRYDQVQGDVHIGKYWLTKGFTPDELKGFLGEPNRYTGNVGGSLSLFYDGQGLVFAFIKDKPLAIGVTLADDEDEKFARGSYKGKVQLNDLILISKTEPEMLEELEGFEFQCPVPIICSTGRTSKVQCLITYNQEGSGEIAQIVFSLNKPRP
ncbi:MAG: hypothetical protein ACI959_001380 [Limisphaerales bacterium]|jgi:hypothetical protein